MATGTITSTGLGSGLDIESLVTKLMSIEKQPITTLQKKDSSFATKLSALGTLKSNLSALQTAAEAISSQTKYAVYKANVADSSVASAVAGSGATAGSYTLEVSSLASAQKVSSSYQSTGYTFADDTLSITIGGKTTNISISAAAGNNTMAGVRDAINAANTGVGARLITDSSGNTRLELNSAKTGTASAFTLSGLGMDFNPSNIAASGGLVDQSISSASSDAIFKINNTTYVRSSNYVTTAITGVTLSLTATNAGNPTVIGISQTNSSSKFAAYTATTADSSIASATASSSASAGSYQLEVSSLASSQKIVTSAQSTGYTFADGTLSLDLGGTVTSLSISASAGNNTLSGVRDAINNANAGLTASLLNDGSGTRLILSATNTGTDSAVSVTGLGLDFNSSDISASGSLVDQTNSKAATNAVFSLDGVEITRASNTVSDALDGVTLNLTKKNVGSPTTLTIAKDSSALQDKVNTLISTYNTVVKYIKAQSAYDADTQTASALNGDTAARSIQSQLRTLVGGSLSSGSLTRLSDVGVTIAKDGTLSLDSTKFAAAVNDPSKDVSALFVETGTVSGFADQIAKKVASLLDTGGILTSRTDGIKKTQTSIEKQIESLTARMDVIEARYRRQFTALDTTVSSWTSTGTYLTTQLSSLLSKYTGN
jgi:flagellar hook-associated protein 2